MISAIASPLLIAGIRTMTVMARDVVTFARRRDLMMDAFHILRAAIAKERECGCAKYALVTVVMHVIEPELFFVHIAVAAE